MDLDPTIRELLEIAPGELDELGFYATRELEDGHWLAVEPQTFGRARLGVSALHSLYGGGIRAAFRLGYGDVFDYASREAAIAAMAQWDGDGEPEGWSRHAATGRRRQPDGSVHVRETDLSDETIAQWCAAAGAGGARHDCHEWIGERSGRCVLCDAAPSSHPGKGEQHGPTS
jgi:hypothetical protein